MHFSHLSGTKEQFPPGMISMPVVRAVELKCNGQSVTLFPQAQLA